MGPALPRAQVGGRPVACDYETAEPKVDSMFLSLQNTVQSLTTRFFAASLSLHGIASIDILMQGSFRRGSGQHWTKTPQAKGGTGNGSAPQRPGTRV